MATRSQKVIEVDRMAKSCSAWIYRQILVVCREKRQIIGYTFEPSLERFEALGISLIFPLDYLKQAAYKIF